MTEEDSVRPKWLTPEQLTNVLRDVPKDARIMVNRVGNLAVFDENWDYQGFIDFLFDGSYEKAT